MSLGNNSCPSDAGLRCSKGEGVPSIYPRQINKPGSGALVCRAQWESLSSRRRCHTEDGEHSRNRMSQDKLEKHVGLPCTTSYDYTLKHTFLRFRGRKKSQAICYKAVISSSSLSTHNLGNLCFRSWRAMTKSGSFYVFISKETNSVHRRGGGRQEMGVGRGKNKENLKRRRKDSLYSPISPY